MKPTETVEVATWYVIRFNHGYWRDGHAQSQDLALATFFRSEGAAVDQMMKMHDGYGSAMDDAKVMKVCAHCSA